MSASEPDPWRVLELAPGSDDEAIRAAYLRKLREFPPERAPDAFERIRDAYEQLRNPQQRARRVLDANPLAKFDVILDGARSGRRWCGPAPWLEALRRR